MSKFNLDAEFVRKMAELLNETGLSEIEYAEGDQRIRLTKQVIVQATTVAAAPAATHAGAAAAPVAAAPAVIHSPASHPGAVKSPMVGTAYHASEPGGPAFAKVGDQVKAGQTILIIEAMKVMNPIKAPVGGTITQILVNDAQPVEFGEPLMIIE